MSEALRGMPENNMARGLSASRGWLEKNEPKGPAIGPPRLLGVTYHRKGRDSGIILNFCPWCGKRIRFDEVEEP